jgi:hypothetical protein
VTRRQSRVLMAAAIWTLYVWISRIVIMSGQDESTGFKVVHGVLALVSIGFALAIGKIGWGARATRRTSRDPSPGTTTPTPEGRRSRSRSNAA